MRVKKTMGAAADGEVKSTINSASQTCDNSASPITVQCSLTLSLSYTVTNTFSFSESTSVTLGMKTTTKVGLPVLCESDLEFSITGTQSFTNGHSSEEAVSMMVTSMASIPVPARSVYSASMVGTQARGTMPYVWTGTAIYKSGNSAPVVNTGIYEGVGTNNFKVIFRCVSSPDGCGSALAPAQMTRPVQNAPVRD
jgi:hypothetical protein